MKLTVHLDKNSYPIYIGSNILSQADHYISEVFSGKKIFISSGILAEKCDKVVSAISDSGFEVLEILEEEGWCAVAAQLKG